MKVKKSMFCIWLYAIPNVYATYKPTHTDDDNFIQYIYTPDTLSKMLKYNDFLDTVKYFIPCVITVNDGRNTRKIHSYSPLLYYNSVNRAAPMTMI